MIPRKNSCSTCKFDYIHGDDYPCAICLAGKGTLWKPKEKIKNRPCNMAEREKHGTNKQRDTGKKDR